MAAQNGARIRDAASRIEILPVRRNEENDICPQGPETAQGRTILDRFQALSRQLGNTVDLAGGNRLELGAPVLAGAK
jgi:hypothetical protein